MKSDVTKALKQIQHVIQSLEERKLELIQDEFAAPLAEIVAIAQEHDLTLELISYAMMQKAPRRPKIAPRKSKRSSGVDSTPNVVSA